MLTSQTRNQMRGRYAIGIGVLVALAVGAIGFGAMFLFWKIESFDYITQYGDTRGLFYFRAATWGDGLCLPILVGALYAYILLLEKISKRHRTISFYIGGILGFMAAVIQASWLISDTTAPNWTIPSPHHFMPSGWYHAGYFIFMFFLIGTLMSQVFFARQASSVLRDQQSPAEKLLLTLAWFSGLSYIFMNNIDDRYSADNYLWMSLITLFLFIIVIGAFCFFSLHPTKRKSLIQQDLVHLFAGAVSAFGFCLLIYHGTADYKLSFITALLAVSFVPPNSDNKSRTLLYIFVSFFTSFWMMITIRSLQNSYYLLVTSICFPLVFYFFSLAQREQPTKIEKAYALTGLMNLTIISFSLLTGIFLESHEIKSTSKDLVVSGILGWLVKTHVDTTFWHIKQKEESQHIDRGEESKNITERAVFITYLLIGLVGMGAFLFFLETVFDFCVERFPAITNLQIPIAINPVLLIILLILNIILFLLGKEKQDKTRMNVSITAIIAVIGIYATIVFGLINANLTYFIAPFHLWNLWTCILIVLIATFLATGFFTNTSKLRALSADKIHAKMTILMSVLIFVGSAICLAIAFCFPSMSVNIFPSWEHYLVCFLLMAYITMGVPLLIARVLNRPNNINLLVANSTNYTGVGHDGFLIFFVAIVGVLTPLFTAGIINRDIIEVLFSAVILISIIYFPITYSFKNNKEQMDDLKEKYANDLQKQEALETVSKHTRRQNALVFVILIPWSLIPFAIKYIEIIHSQTTANIKTSAETESDQKEKRGSQSSLKALYESYMPIVYIRGGKDEKR